MNKKRAAVFSLIVMLVVLVFSSVASLIQAQDFGTNWTGTFFPSNNLTGTGTPVSNIQGKNYVQNITKFVEFFARGTYICTYSPVL